MTLLFVAGILIIAYLIGFSTFLYRYYKLSDLGYDLPGPMNPTLMSVFYTRIKTIENEDSRKEVRKIIKIYKSGITVAAIFNTSNLLFVV